MERCIDISAWQGTVSTGTFQRNRDDIPSVYVRASYTSQSEFKCHKDKYFAHNIENAYRANLKLGAYHYSQAVSETEAIAEAKFIVNTLAPYKKWITLPVAFDWEFGGRLNSYRAKQMGKQRCKQICDAFCRTIRAAGYTPMVYANLSTLNGYIASDIYKDWLIWVAQYSSKCNYKHPRFMWQYSSSGKVSGIKGNIDMNWLYGYNAEPKPVSTYMGELPKLPFRGWFSSGDKGEEVKKLQRFLNWYGGYGLEVDGVVGRKTINAVKHYQGRERPYLVVDGAFGRKCLERARIVRR